MRETGVPSSTTNINHEKEMRKEDVAVTWLVCVW